MGAFEVEEELPGTPLVRARRPRCTRGGAALVGVAVLLVLCLAVRASPASASTPLPRGSFGSCAAQPSSFAPLRWGVKDLATADRICCHNRDYAEYFGYWESTGFPMRADAADPPITFYDVATGRPLVRAARTPRAARFERARVAASAGWPTPRAPPLLAPTRTPPLPPRPQFVAPRGRSMAAFISESTKHGWCACEPRARLAPVADSSAAACAGRASATRRSSGKTSSFCRAVRRSASTARTSVSARAGPPPRALPSACMPKPHSGQRLARGTRSCPTHEPAAHAGHNLPDGRNRYCINIVCVAWPDASPDEA
jgi:hypothetical protein